MKKCSSVIYPVIPFEISNKSQNEGLKLLDDCGSLFPSYSIAFYSSPDWLMMICLETMSLALIQLVRVVITALFIFLKGRSRQPNT